jgi:hypothetical protein
MLPTQLIILYNSMWLRASTNYMTTSGHSRTYHQNLTCSHILRYNTIRLLCRCHICKNCITPELITLIQGDQKVSVHMTITAYHQVQRDFLINLYINLKFRNILKVQTKGSKVLVNYIQVTFSLHWSRLAKYLYP